VWGSFSVSVSAGFSFANFCAFSACSAVLPFEKTNRKERKAAQRTLRTGLYSPGNRYTTGGLDTFLCADYIVAESIPTDGGWEADAILALLLDSKGYLGDPEGLLFS